MQHPWCSANTSMSRSNASYIEKRDLLRVLILCCFRLMVASTFTKMCLPCWLLEQVSMSQKTTGKPNFLLYCLLYCLLCPPPLDATPMDNALVTLFDLATCGIYLIGVSELCLYSSTTSSFCFFTCFRGPLVIAFNSVSVLSAHLFSSK